MDVYGLLGIDADADERAIKRAYARELKRTRPDEDPVAFQRLHEAYQTALQWSRNRVEVDDEDDDGWETTGEAAAAPDAVVDPDEVDGQQDGLVLRWQAGDAMPPSMPSVSAALADILGDVAMREAPGDVTVPPPATRAGARQPAPPPLRDALARHAFDPWQFFEDLVERAAAGQTEQLAGWLGQHAALYDLDHKRQAADVVRHGVETREIALSTRQAMVLAQFFGIDDQAWATRATVRWLLQQEHTADYGEASPLAVRQLKRPFQWKRALLYASVPTLAPRIAALGHRLADEYGRLPPGIVQEQQAFFMQVADPAYFGRWRWAAMALRSLALGLVVAISGLVFAEQKLWVLGVGAAYAGGWFGLEIGLLLARLMMHWQRTSQATAWQLWAPALLAFAGLVPALVWPVTQWLGYGLALIACLVYWRRFFSLLRFCLGSWWLGELLSAGRIEPAIVAIALAPVWITALDALHAWRKGVPLAAVDDNRWTLIGSYVVFAAGLIASLVFG